MTDTLDKTQINTSVELDDPVEDMEVIEEAIEDAREKVQDMKDHFFKKNHEEAKEPVESKDDPLEEMKEFEDAIEDAREKVQDMKDRHFKHK